MGFSFPHFSPTQVKIPPIDVPEGLSLLRMDQDLTFADLIATRLLPRYRNTVMNSKTTPDRVGGEAEQLSRDEADRLYRATGAIVDPGAVLADFIARSRAFRQAHGGLLDIAYGDGPDETMDIFLPASPGAAMKVHVFIHGGYWYQFGKDEWSFIAEALTAAGAIVIVPRYSLCPAVKISDITHQMQAMLCWVWHNIAAHGGDPGQIFVSGHSAGAHLALELHCPDWQAGRYLPADLLKGMTLISGLYDLRPIRSSYVQAHVRLSAAEAEACSPLLRIRPSATPLIVALAQEDPPGFHSQAASLVARWTACGNDLIMVAANGQNHLTELFELSRPGGILSEAIMAQMGLSQT